MQANKVSETTTTELKRWLEKPGTSAEAGLGLGIQQDLQWLENSKDLSSIEMNEPAKTPQPQVPDTNGSGGGGGGGGGGFFALFGCGGKRK